MLKWLLAVAIALVVLTVLSPWLSKYGLGRLPTTRFIHFMFFSMRSTTAGHSDAV